LCSSSWQVHRSGFGDFGSHVNRPSLLPVAAVPNPPTHGCSTPPWRCSSTLGGNGVAARDRDSCNCERPVTSTCCFDRRTMICMWGDG
uniref:Uncharacterized protein n=1 Tax=Aegilops tauschii subsp. strangulata TaxID=200361 RepID=A0A453C155_AEGTS